MITSNAKTIHITALIVLSVRALDILDSSGISIFSSSLSSSDESDETELSSVKKLIDASD